MMPWPKHLKQKGVSEQACADQAGISRLTIRSISQGKTTLVVNSLIAAAKALELKLLVLLCPQAEVNADLSTYAVGTQVLMDGPNSWKIHFMNFIDEFRRTLDPRLIILPPPKELSLELRGLLASIVLSLCEEAAIEAPDWARRRYDLPKPWFVAETESLKAMALLESPLPFRRNQIFVTSNFMDRV
jgi:transcriptional regulator with XRE-family HTH domain